jgi:deazaflavin-dependent oxidoreductase (nitroreductase family)
MEEQTRQSKEGTMADQQAYNRQMIKDFRESREATGVPMDGRPLVLITTTGAKSGKPYTAPLMYVPDGDRILIIASSMGAAKHPDWYHNLAAHPDVTVEVGAKTYQARATILEGSERERIWAMIVQQYPFFTEHQSKTTRQIPIIALEQL